MPPGMGIQKIGTVRLIWRIGRHLLYRLRRGTSPPPRGIWIGSEHSMRKRSSNWRSRSKKYQGSNHSWSSRRKVDSSSKIKQKWSETLVGSSRSKLKSLDNNYESLHRSSLRCSMIREKCSTSCITEKSLPKKTLKGKLKKSIKLQKNRRINCSLSWIIKAIFIEKQ